MRRLLPFLIIGLGLLAVYVDLPGSKFAVLSNIDAGLNQKLETKLGLDLQGGFEIKYGAVTPPGAQDPSSAQMETIRSIMENRVNSTGVSEPIVETVGSNEVLVQVPGATDPTAIEKLVGQTGQLDFVLMPPDKYGDATGTATCPTLTTGCLTLPADQSQIDPSLPAQFTGKQLDPNGISAAADPSSPGYWLVNFAFSGSAANDFATWTAAHLNDYFAIVLDGVVQGSPPYIKSAITGGQGQITGKFTAAQAKSLATILSYGALPYPVAEESSQQIPASLGQTFLNQTLFAGAIGIGLVLLFMLVYYRLPGLVACLALIYYGLAVYAIFRVIPVTLTLAGIAGFVLSVGMAVDANILIFERTKEELRAGKTLATAVEAGFSRAWNSIFDSNVSSLITAFILYFFGSSTIKGFALVLIVGVATSMFTAVTVSRTLLRFVVKQQMAQKAWLFGVSDEEFQARAMGGRLARREARGRV
ncbi:MAG: protein translocase subunit SecD [Candidatus Limnocylindrales bacterium]